jgi:hypothetical protein
VQRGDPAVERLRSDEAKLLVVKWPGSAGEQGVHLADRLLQTL